MSKRKRSSILNYFFSTCDVIEHSDAHLAQISQSLRLRLVEYLFSHANIHLKQNNLAQADKLVALAKRLPQGDSEIMLQVGYRLGSYLFHTDRPAEALVHLDELYTKFKRNKDLLIGATLNMHRGNCMAALGMAKKARQAFRYALSRFERSEETDPSEGFNCVAARYNLGAIEFGLKNYGVAEELADRTLEDCSRLWCEKDHLYASAMLLKGNICDALERLSEADLWYKRAAKLFHRAHDNETESDLFSRRGYIALSQDNSKSSAQLLRKSLSLKIALDAATSQIRLKYYGAELLRAAGAKTESRRRLVKAANCGAIDGSQQYGELIEFRLIENNLQNELESSRPLSFHTYARSIHGHYRKFGHEGYALQAYSTAKHQPENTPGPKVSGLLSTLAECVATIDPLAAASYLQQKDAIETRNLPASPDS